MRPPRHAAMLLVLLWSLSACESDSTGPRPGAPQDASFEAVLTDPDLTATAIEEAGVAAASIPEEARALLEQARQKFQQAREAFRAGDLESAARLAEEGRLLVAQAILLVHGEEAYPELAARLDHILTWLEERVDGEEDPPLLARLRELQAEAEAAWSSGDAVRALERLLLALQIANHARLRAERDVLGAARLSVAMGASAMERARETIGSAPSEVQARLLSRAVELQRRARLALEAGFPRRAFVLARHVVEITLVAVLNAERPDETDVEGMAQLADRLITAAENAVGEAPTEAQARILQLARSWQARGLELATESPGRSVALLWRAAVLAGVLT